MYVALTEALEALLLTTDTRHTAAHRPTSRIEVPARTGTLVSQPEKLSSCRDLVSSTGASYSREAIAASSSRMSCREQWGMRPRVRT